MGSTPREPKEVKMKKRLLVISNHPPEKWGEDQKKGWDEIIYHPFPQVDPAGDLEQPLLEIRNVVYQNKGEGTLYLCCQGDFSLTARVVKEWAYANAYFDGYWLRDPLWEDVVLVFPTTQRVAEEKFLEDGKVEKISVFKFVRWREI